MAQRVQVILEDDLDGSPASHQISFSFDGVSYDIDLNDEHASEFREAMAVWTTHARRSTTRNTKSRRSSSSSQSGTSATVIREWAKEQGMEVSARGRVPANVRAAYEAAHA